DDQSGLFMTGDSVVAHYNPVNLKPIKYLRDVSPAGVDLHALALRPDKKELLVGYGNQIIFLKPETLARARPGWTTDNEILDAQYTPDGQNVFIGRSNNVAELRKASDGSLVGQSMTHERAVVSVAVSPDGTMLLTGSRDQTARFWDAATGL